jgi:hypothetical protein
LFRLVKVLNSDTKAEVQLIPKRPSSTFSRGEALVCFNGYASSPTSTAFPEYIYLSQNYVTNPRKLEAMAVTEDSVFKADYSGTVTPYIGMPVGLSTKISGMDAVNYSSTGKGIIIGIDTDKDLVYVRFRK